MRTGSFRWGAVFHPGRVGELVAFLDSQRAAHEFSPENVEVIESHRKRSATARARLTSLRGTLGSSIRSVRPCPPDNEHETQSSYMRDT